MSVVAVSMVRDEVDIISRIVNHMADEVDLVIVADNASRDGTREVLEDLRERRGIEIVDDPEIGYYQSRKMTALAQLARKDFGATWIVPFDADEWWYSPHGRIADVLSAQGHHTPILTAELHDHVATGEDDMSITDPVARMGWRRRTAGALPKVACRAAPDLVIDQGNHGARYAAPAPQRSGLLQIRHFPYRSAEQFVKKAINGAEAYAATDLPFAVGQHWREYGRMVVEHGEDVVKNEVFYRWFYVEEPRADEGLIYDPVPLSS